MKDLNIPLNDIAPLVEIDDYSFYYFIALVVLIGAGVLTLMFFVLKYVRNRRKTARRIAYEELCSIDLSDPKKAAYSMGELGRVFAHDNERTDKAFHALFERLEPYKYAPNVDPIDEETLGYYRLYLGIIDV